MYRVSDAGPHQSDDDILSADGGPLPDIRGPAGGAGAVPLLAQLPHRHSDTSCCHAGVREESWEKELLTEVIIIILVTRTPGYRTLLLELIVTEVLMIVPHLVEHLVEHQGQRTF